MARRKDHTREQLHEMAIQAAATVLEKEGPEVITARRIAREIGYAPGTLYNVFADLEELMLHVAGRALDDLRSDLVAARQRAAGAAGDATVAMVMALARTQLDFMRRRPAAWWQLFHVGWPDDRLFPKWYIAKISAAMAELEAALLPEFETDDLFRERLARTLWAGFFGICEVAALRQLMIVPADDIEGMTRYMVEACINQARTDLNARERRT
ncbi:MAG: TetR/AcrR family transcriptional regulator [Alphaproteobacteria bacterium]|nr:TetR/AcrR family transcriptional regulator [Alphaproteobacteria bacterium]